MKPKIICHIMSSVDGRLIDGRWTAPYEAERGDLLKVYAAIGRELNTDAWMFGKIQSALYLLTDSVLQGIPYHPMSLPYSSANAIRNACLSLPTRKATSILLPQL